MEFYIQNSKIKNDIIQNLLVYQRHISKRRKRDLNPRAAINDLLPFQGSPFGQLGYFSKSVRKKNFAEAKSLLQSGEGGIRTHVPSRTNGFQDRLVMTTSIPLHLFCCCHITRDNMYSSIGIYILSTVNFHFFYTFMSHL